MAKLGTEQLWEKGKAAFEWLNSAAESAYKHFLQGHRAFPKQREVLVANGAADPGELVRWLPLRFMETVGVECAVWPHLYWKTDMTETWARSKDVPRQERARKKQQELEEEPEPIIPISKGFRGDEPETEENRAMDVDEPEPQTQQERTPAEEGRLPPATFTGRSFR